MFAFKQISMATMQRPTRKQALPEICGSDGGIGGSRAVRSEGQADPSAVGDEIRKEERDERRWCSGTWIERVDRSPCP